MRPSSNWNRDRIRLEHRQASPAERSDLVLSAEMTLSTPAPRTGTLDTLAADGAVITAGVAGNLTITGDQAVTGIETAVSWMVERPRS